MNSCSNLFYLSSIACALAECLSEDDLSILSTDLVTLGDMLGSIIIRQNACSNQ